MQPYRPRTAVLLLFTLAWLMPAIRAEAETVPCPDGNKLKVSLGWSFGFANSPFAAGDDNLDHDSAPLIALQAHVDDIDIARVDVLLALANFGRLTSIVESGGGGVTDSTATAEVRRAMLADLSVVFLKQFAVKLNVNGGFVFDAQREADSTSVADASAYIFIGPQLQACFDKSRLVVDLLVGQSEVMTGVDLFSQTFDKHMLRFRPRLHFTMDGIKDDKVIAVGMWADLGFSEKHGDTYEVFVSFPIWESPEGN